MSETSEVTAKIHGFSEAGATPVSGGRALPMPIMVSAWGCKET